MEELGKVGEDELLSIGERIVKNALKRGVDEAEAYIVYAESREASAQNNKVHMAYAITETGLGIRVTIGNRIGYAYSNSFNAIFMEKAVNDAISVARSSKQDPYWSGLPDPEPLPHVKEIYSDELRYMTLADMVTHLKDLLDESLKDKRITLVEGSVYVSFGEVAIVNSRGLNVWERRTSSSVVVDLVANEGSDTSPSTYEYRVSRVTIPDPRDITRECVNKAVTSLHPIKIDQGRIEVIFSPYALASLFSFTLEPALRGDYVVRGRSPLKNKLNAKIASKVITLIDDGLYKGGLSTSAFDGEGVPSQRTDLINDGILQNFIFDTYWAGKIGRKSTGNAGRGSYMTQPSITFSNIIIKSGSKRLLDYLNEANKVLLVDELQGAHSSNPETGEFSVIATPAWIVTKGDLKPVKGVMVAGNVYDLIKKASFVSRETKVAGNFISPWVSFEDVRIVG